MQGKPLRKYWQGPKKDDLESEYSIRALHLMNKLINRGVSRDVAQKIVESACGYDFELKRLASLIPALMLSTSAGEVVTKSSSKDKLGSVLLAEFSKEPRVFLFSSGLQAWEIRSWHTKFRWGYKALLSFWKASALQTL